MSQQSRPVQLRVLMEVAEFLTCLEIRIDIPHITADNHGPGALHSCAYRVELNFVKGFARRTSTSCLYMAGIEAHAWLATDAMQAICAVKCILKIAI